MKHIKKFENLNNLDLGNVDDNILYELINRLSKIEDLITKSPENAIIKLKKLKDDISIYTGMAKYNL